MIRAEAERGSGPGAAVSRPGSCGVRVTGQLLDTYLLYWLLGVRRVTLLRQSGDVSAARTPARVGSSLGGGASQRRASLGLTLGQTAKKCVE